MTAFFDTNIIVYAFSTDAKREHAIDTMAPGGCISTQVLNEFTSVLHRKQRQSWMVIEAAIRTLTTQFSDILPLTTLTNASAIALARSHNFSFYDALIVASALEAGCDTLYSEDFHDGHRLQGLTIVNPFSPDAR